MGTNMQQLPVEIKCQIVNFFILFFHQSNKVSEDEILTQASKSRRLTTGENLHNIQSVVHLSETSKEWYGFINHKRMNRLWKSCYFILRGGYSSQLMNEVTDGTVSQSTQTERFKSATAVRFKETHKRLLSQESRSVLTNGDKQAIQSLLSRPFLQHDWAQKNIADHLRVVGSSKLQQYALVIDCIVHSIIENNRGFELISRSTDTFLHFMKSVIKYSQILLHFKQMIKYEHVTQKLFCTCEEMENLTGQSIDELICGGAKLEELPIFKSFLREYRKRVNTPRVLSEFLKKMWQQHTNFNTILKRLLALNDVGPTDTSGLLQQVFQHYAKVKDQGPTGFLEMVNFLIKEFRIDPDHEDHADVLHVALKQNASNVKFYDVAFKNYKRWLAPKLITKVQGKLPIEVFMSHSALRNHRDTITILGILFDNCPDIRRYKANGVSTGLTIMLAGNYALHPHKLEYTKFFRRLE